MRHRPLLHFCTFLILTIAAGLVLRWQLTGIMISGTELLDWRRAHSHLGFYGVLFPLAWICWHGRVHVWLPGPRVWLFYVGLVAFAGFAFLWQGYGFFSIVASTGVLGVWLLFAWKNRPGFKFWQTSWLTPASISIFFSALLIGAVAIKTKSDPALANQLARAFLSLLLFGVFLPATLALFTQSPPHPVLWFLATAASALFLTELVAHPLLGLGPVYLAAEIFKTLWLRQIPFKDWKLKLAWSVFALGLVLTGLKITPYSYYQAIAGVHFLILGPLLMSFALIRLHLKIPRLLRWIYELSLVAMVSGIALQGFVTTPLGPLTTVASTILVIVLAALIALGVSERLTAVERYKH